MKALKKSFNYNFFENYLYRQLIFTHPLNTVKSRMYSELRPPSLLRRKGERGGVLLIDLTFFQRFLFCEFNFLGKQGESLKIQPFHCFFSVKEMAVVCNLMNVFSGAQLNLIFKQKAFFNAI